MIQHWRFALSSAWLSGLHEAQLLMHKLAEEVGDSHLGASGAANWIASHSRRAWWPAESAILRLLPSITDRQLALEGGSSKGRCWLTCNRRMELPTSSAHRQWASWIGEPYLHRPMDIIEPWRGMTVHSAALAPLIGQVFRSSYGRFGMLEEEDLPCSLRLRKAKV